MVGQPLPERLKLRAREVADMDVVAALLQDAIVPLVDMAYLQRERRFVLVVNRFMWELTGEAPERVRVAREGDARFEDGEGGASRFWRSHAAVTFERVRAVSSRNLPSGRKDVLLNLLTVAAEPRRITLYFSGDRQVRLEVGDLRCRLEDLGEPWPAAAMPDHEEGAAEGVSAERAPARS
jgi:hypothetical protein